MSAPEISKIIAKSIITTKRYLAELKKARKIEFRGAPKNGGYYLLYNERQISAKTNYFGNLNANFGQSYTNG